MLQPRHFQFLRPHLILLAFVIGNLALVLAFPPCDYVPLDLLSLPNFDAFYPVWDIPEGRSINLDILILTILAILINACLAWLFITPNVAPAPRRTTRLLFSCLLANLAIILLFPPLADYRSLSTTVIPSFQGFYFAFADNSGHKLVDQILFLEIIILLINTAMIWLIMRERHRQNRQPTATTDRAF